MRKGPTLFAARATALLTSRRTNCEKVKSGQTATQRMVAQFRKIYDLWAQDTSFTALTTTLVDDNRRPQRGLERATR